MKDQETNTRKTENMRTADINRDRNRCGVGGKGTEARAPGERPTRRPKGSKNNGGGGIGGLRDTARREGKNCLPEEALPLAKE